MWIRKSKTLQNLDISNNFIGRDECLAIASALGCNATLQILDVRHNEGINDAVVQNAIENTLRNMNYAVEYCHSEYATPAITALCDKNRRMKRIMQNIDIDMPRISLGLWPKVFERVESKPDYLFHLLKSKPDVCRENLRPDSRRRKRPERFE